MKHAASQFSHGEALIVILPQAGQYSPKVLAGTCVGHDSSNTHVLVQFEDETYETAFIPISQIQ